MKTTVDQSSRWRTADIAKDRKKKKRRLTTNHGVGFAMDERSRSGSEGGDGQEHDDVQDYYDDFDGDTQYSEDADLEIQRAILASMQHSQGPSQATCINCEDDVLFSDVLQTAPAANTSSAGVACSIALRGCARRVTFEFCFPCLLA